MWYEWAHDPKIQMLTEQDQRRHAMLMCFRCEGKPFNLDEFAFAMRLSRDELETTIGRLGDMLAPSGEEWMPAWRLRQGKSDAERAEEYRAKSPVIVTTSSRDGHVIVTDLSQRRHASDADADAEAEVDTDSSGEHHAEATTPPPELRSGGCPDGDLRPDEVRHADDPRWQAKAEAPAEAPDCGECSDVQGKACLAGKVVPGSPACDAAIVARLDTEAEARKAKEPAIPYEDIVAAYHELLPTLAKVRAFGPKSKIREHLTARWNDDATRHSVEWWRTYFGDVAEMPWLMGEDTGKDGSTFSASFGWLMLPTNMDKVLNGHYRRRAKPKAAKGWVDENGTEWCPGNCGRPVSDCWCEMYRQREEEAKQRRAAAEAKESAKGDPSADHRV